MTITHLYRSYNKEDKININTNEKNIILQKTEII